MFYSFTVSNIPGRNRKTERMWKHFLIEFLERALL
jgi:hypothetical protein